MNTVFKFYLEAWSLLGVASAVVLYELWKGQDVTSGRARAVWRGAVGVALALALFTSLSGLRGILTMERVPGPSMTLDGTAYLGRFIPYDRSAYEWLNANVPGIPVLCEAWGPSYQEYSRASMNTGLPIVIGWDYHVFQRGHSRNEIDRRKADVQTIYTSSDENEVAAALKRYHVALVYVGQLERGTYPGGNLANFRKWTDLMAPVYENAGVAIFAVSGAFAGGTPVETIETVVEEKAAPEHHEEKRQDAAGRMSQPRGAAGDKDGNVYVADFGNARIQKLDTNLAPLLAFGRKGKGPGEFQDPCGVAVGPSGDVFVADTWNGRVQVFTPDGKYLREWGGDYFGPRGIAVDASGSVFLCDTGNGRVVRFSSDGKKEAVIGSKGDKDGQLFEPVGVGVDGAGRLLVCDNGNGRLQTFERDGRFLSTFPVPGWTREVFSEPGVAVDDSGTLWVTVPRQHEVRAYTPDGKLVKTIKKDDLPANARFETPVGIAWIAAKKKLVVTDIENRVLWIDPSPSP
jgi:sugar lactone lactonase YvrE